MEIGQNQTSSENNALVKEDKNVTSKPEIATQNPSSTESSSSGKKSKLPIMIGVAVFILLALGVWLLLKAKTTSVTSTKNNKNIAVSTEREKALKDIRIIANYVESQRNPDGFYEYVYRYDDQCTTEGGVKKCPFNGQRVFQTTNAWTALAHFSAYKALNDPKELAKASRDLGKLMDWCAPDPTKCLWVLAQPAIIYQDTKDQKILDFLNKEAAVLEKYKNSNDLMLSSIEARELGLIYQITNNVDLLNAAKNRLGYASNLWRSQPNTYRPEINLSFPINSCWLGLASTSIADAKSDPQLLANIQLFMNQGKILENFSEFGSAVRIQPCIETYSNLYSIGGDVNNINMAKAIVTKFLDKFYDGPSQNFRYGKGATTIVSKDADQSVVESKFTDLTDTSYTAFLLYKVTYEK